MVGKYRIDAARLRKGRNMSFSFAVSCVCFFPRPMFCLPNVASFYGLSILDFSFGFFLYLLRIQTCCFVHFDY